MKIKKLKPRTPDEREEDKMRIDMLKMLLKEQKAIENELKRLKK